MPPGPMGGVYVAQQERGGMVKIGISKNPDQRIRGISQAGPLAVRKVQVYFVRDMRAAWEIEQRVLSELQDHRALGEWLCCSPDIVVAKIDEIIVSRCFDEC